MNALSQFRQNLLYSNESPSDVQIILEPWGEEYFVSPGDRIEFVGIGGDPGSAFEIHQTGKGLVVYGWAGSVVTAIKHGFVIQRKPVEEIPLEEEDSHCRVCGYRSADPPWGIDGVTPLYDFCDCCGVEHGYQDCLPAAARQYRDRWIASGAEWYTKKSAPVNWDLSTQLGRVPADFK